MSPAKILFSYIFVVDFPIKLLKPKLSTFKSINEGTLKFSSRIPVLYTII